MKLCRTKYFANFGWRFGVALLALALVVGLPVAGGRWSGLPATVWYEFPPRQIHVRHAAFDWGVWVGLALALFAVVVAVVWRMGRVARALRARALHQARVCPEICPCAERPGYLAVGMYPMPSWGWMGLVCMLLAWVVAWTRFPALAVLQRHTYVLLWSGYITTVMALTQCRAGTCLFTRRPLVLAGLTLVSAVFWWGFEFLNRAVQNWFYQNVECFTPSAYVVLASLSFATVLPAVLCTHDWLATYPRLTASFENWVCIRLAHPRRVGAGVAVAGAVGLFLLPVWPNALFPLLWLAPLALLCGVLAAVGEPTLFDDLGHGDWRTLIRLSLAAMLCGCFWEMWNMYSLTRWVYEVPYVGRFKIFEMPLLGFAGYAPFGWECAAVAMVFGLWQPPASIARTSSKEDLACGSNSSRQP